MILAAFRFYGLTNIVAQSSIFLRNNRGASVRRSSRFVPRRRPAPKEPRRPEGLFTKQQEEHRERARLFADWKQEKQIQAEIPKLLRSGREIGYRGKELIEFVRQKLQEERAEAACD